MIVVMAGDEVEVIELIGPVEQTRVMNGLVVVVAVVSVATSVEGVMEMVLVIVDVEVNTLEVVI